MNPLDQTRRGFLSLILGTAASAVVGGAGAVVQAAPRVVEQGVGWIRRLDGRVTQFVTGYEPINLTAAKAAQPGVVHAEKSSSQEEASEGHHNPTRSARRG